ncbi:MAG: trypsin-like peptidase domain-containing protein [Candidatus Saccharibacteria bacterium]|nr:trypsin-like peptidase domain-containing protein [Candidatus Saccharibacteria bacterium]
MQPQQTTQPVLQPTSQPSYRGLKVVAAIVGVVLLIGVVFGAGALGAWLVLKGHKPAQFAAPQTPGFDGNTVVSADEADVENVVKKVAPSVVSILVRKVNGGGSAGTGVIISGDGYVITNKHVIDGGRQIAVVTVDGTTYSKVSIIGTDPLNDIGFLKIEDAKDLPQAALGDSSTVRVGQKVIAIGNARGHQNSVTSGIISGKGRPIATRGEAYGDVQVLSDLLQTDTAINHGNSGGPLLNMAGQVIGINTAIDANSQNIGFSIPVNATKGLVRTVKEKGRVERAYAGMRYRMITPEVRVEYKLDQKQGALVIGDNAAVAPGSPADKAGVKSGDIITKVNGRTVGEHGGLTSLISEYAPGDTIQLVALRHGKEMTFTLTLQAYTQAQ